MATPQEEIQRQHDEALRLLSTLPNDAPPDVGEIDLKYKRVPLSELLVSSLSDPSRSENLPLPPKDPSVPVSSLPLIASVPCVSTRGVVDVTSLKSLVTPGHNTPIEKSPAIPTMWDDALARSSNVLVTRPSHDAWGIKKIVLMFCDDFLQRVYEMPWWYDEGSGFKTAIAPILEKLGVGGEWEERRIVRMLLASMPPGVTIPHHHDTGDWVNKTHRVHVPVITDAEKVLFRCGGGSWEDMKRVRCDEGRVFEMNNQAKHAVSNHWSSNRVHLILDYVDADFKIEERIKLRKGEELVQTRRSIDRKADFGKRQTPSYLIIGAQKAGTTSMYEYINQHPLAVKGRRRETHFFDWRWQNNLKTAKEQKDFYDKFFFANDLKLAPSCLTGDSTPSYLLHSDIVIPRVKAVCPWVKLIVMLRDPVDRALSHYKMVTSEDGNEAQKMVRGVAWKGMTFEEVVDKEIGELESAGVLGEDAGEAEWARYLKTLPMGTGSHSLLARGMYWMQLKAWINAFGRERFLILKMEDMKREGVQKAVGMAYKHLGLPDYKIDDEGAKNSRKYDGMAEETRERLRNFYRRWDAELFSFLGWDSGWATSGE